MWPEFVDIVNISRGCQNLKDLFQNADKMRMPLIVASDFLINRTSIILFRLVVDTFLRPAMVCSTISRRQPSVMILGFVEAEIA